MLMHAVVLALFHERIYRLDKAITGDFFLLSFEDFYRLYNFLDSAMKSTQG